MDSARISIGSALVLGLGKTGLSVARFLASELGRSVDSVTVYGGLSAERDAEVRGLEEAGCRVILGTEDVEGTYDLGVVSPGIPEHCDFYLAGRAACREFISEPELAWRLSPEHWIGITGTNGKTTTTTLTRDLLRAGGIPAEAVGNIGAPALEAALTREDGVRLVCELSSYQLTGASRMHPGIGAVVNIAPDHLSWHGSYERYIAAKERLFLNFGADDLAVVSQDDEPCRALTERLLARGIRVCRVSVEGVPEGPDAAWLEDGSLMLRSRGEEIRLLGADELSIPGTHNVQNALVASAIAYEAGVGAEDIAACLRTFSALEHRIETVDEIEGVRFVNDSKGTNVDAATRALESFPAGSIIVLLGGRDKQTPLEDFSETVRSVARIAVCYGEAGPRFAEALRAERDADGAQVLEAAHLKDAFELAAEHARAGEVVLLSPACSSFDEFKNYEERGTYFKSLVRELSERRRKETRG